MNNLTKYVPFLTALMIMIQMIGVIFYYYLFNIDITPYMTFSYLLVSFTSTVAKVVCFVVFPAMAFDYITGMLKSKVRKFVIVHIVKNIGFVISFIALGLIMYAITNDRQTSLNVGIFPILFFFSFTYLLLSLSTPGLIQNANIVIQGKSASITGVIFLWILFTFTNSYINYKITKEYPEDRKVTLILKDGSMFTKKDNEFYIGQTNEKYFTYNLLTRQTRVINADEVKQVFSGGK